jgi:hypothetical protein
MNPDLPQQVQSVIEAICELGCERVNEIIASLESGNVVSEIAGLNNSEQVAVLVELKAIMSVYDENQT